MYKIGSSNFDHGLTIWMDYLAKSKASIDCKPSEAMQVSIRKKWEMQRRKRGERGNIRNQSVNELGDYMRRLQYTDVIMGHNLEPGHWSQDRFSFASE